MDILVVGANGRVGRELLHQLPPGGGRICALTRKPQTSGFPAHVEEVSGDLTAPETLDACLHGIDAVFLVWLAPPTTVAAVLERIAKHARRVVFLSSPYKTRHPFFQAAQPNALSVLHAQIEGLIETSGMEWTFLRPGMFAANTLLWWASQIRSGDVVRWPCAEALTAPIHERDIAAVAARALCEDGHAGAEYVLTGPQSMSQAAQLTELGNALGRPLRICEISAEEARRELAPLMPPAIVSMLLAAWSAAIGQPALVTSTVADITGTRARTFFEWAVEHAADFQT